MKQLIVKTDSMSLNTLPINRTYKLKIKIIEGGISTIIDDKVDAVFIDGSWIKQL